MKKQISYLLTLVLVLSLCGVMGPVNKTVKTAEYGSTVDITNDFSRPLSWMPFLDKKKKYTEKIPKGTYYVKVDGLNNLPFEFMMK